MDPVLVHAEQDSTAGPDGIRCPIQGSRMENVASVTAGKVGEINRKELCSIGISVPMFHKQCIRLSGKGVIFKIEKKKSESFFDQLTQDRLYDKPGFSGTG